MAQNFWTAIWAWSVCFAMTIAVSLVTKPRSDGELHGLVYSLTQPIDTGREMWWKRPAILGAVLLALTLALNLTFR
jgi:SSS family solute:Na+ symporter